MAQAPSRMLFTEITDFIVSEPSLNEIIAYRPSETLNERLHDLLYKNANDSLSGDEKHELDEFLRLDHLIRMLKAKARLRLAEG